MEIMDWIDVVSRVVHISTAICLIGGSVFIALVLGPRLQALGNPQALVDVMDSVKGRWKLWVHAGIGLFLVSGFYNYIRAMPLHRVGDKSDGFYHALIGTKILLALAVMVIASGLVGRSKAFQFMRDSSRMLQVILILLALVVVSISGFAKVRGVPESLGSAPSPVIAETE